MTLDAPLIDTEATLRLADTVAARIRAARKARGLTLQNVADRCHTSAQTIQRLETATMTLSMDWLERLCTAMAIEPFELFRPDSRLTQLTNTLREARVEADVMLARGRAFTSSIETFLREIERGIDDRI